MLCPRVAMATLPVLKHSPAQFLPWGTSRAVSPGSVLPSREAGREEEREREREEREEKRERWKCETRRGRREPDRETTDHQRETD